jgi:hypothetical protein
LGRNSNILDMEETREYWLNCLAEYEEALEQEFLMKEGKGFNDNMIQLLKFEINECIKHLA